MGLNSDITPEELEVFYEELDEQISVLEEGILRLDAKNARPELLQEIFRAAHTIKGSSALAGFRELNELTHSMENLLDRLRNRDLSQGPV